LPGFCGVRDHDRPAFFSDVSAQELHSMNHCRRMIAVASALLLSACLDESQTTLNDTAPVSAFNWPLPADVPRPREPADNPMTAEKVELGRFLFYDIRLSGNGTQSCGSCHQQALAFTDGLPRGIGSTGAVLARSSQTLTNAAYNATLTWANPALTELEQQMLVPLFGENPVEMGITDANRDEVLDRIRSAPEYASLFAAAFPGEADAVNFGNIIKAIASFQRRLLSFDSPFDRYERGDSAALSPAAQRGMALFNSESMECFHCHGSFNFTQSSTHASLSFIEKPFHNTGLFNIGGTGAFPDDNTGIFSITGNPDDMGKFRAPTLRNIALTAPYMHDGSLATLENVLDFYAEGGRNISSGAQAGDGRLNPHKSAFIRGFTLTAQDKADLVAFMESLTDTAFVTDPALADPFAN
jgi:cytochrome c peroxidase